MNNLKKNSKVVTMFLSIGLMILVLGFSYAFFIYNKTGLYTHTITGGKMKVIYDELVGNNITIENAYPRTDEEALTKALEFEFTITGYNESDKNIYYAIEMDHGSDINGKNRFLDTDIKLTLFENDELIFENEIFENLDNQDIHYNFFESGTSSQSPTINNYKMRIWINDNVIISDTLSNNFADWSDSDFEWFISRYDLIDDFINEVETKCGDNDACYLNDLGISVYTSDEFQNSYANFKVNVKADLTYDDIGYLSYDANGGEFDVQKTSLTTGRITLQKPVKEGKGFLGWSSDPNATEPEFFPGDVYLNDGKMLYAVYSDIRNVMTNFPEEITSINYEIDYIKFVNLSPEEVENETEIADVVVDLTYDELGKVTGYVIEDTLYIASEGTTYLSDGYELFKGFSSLNNIDFGNGDSYYVENMESMFSFGTGGGIFVNNDSEEYEVIQLSDEESIPVFSNFEGFRTDNAKTMKKMFYKVDSIYGLSFENFNTSNVEDMSYMFSTTYINEIDVSSFDTSQVTDMSYMFSDNMYLRTLKVDNFVTEKVTNMAWMFGDNVELSEIDVSSFDTSNVTNMEGMFSGSGAYYGNIRYLDLSNFDTSKVTNMENIFYFQTELNYLDISNFDVSNITDFSGMFCDLYNLEELNLSSFDTSLATTMYRMFYNCGALKSLDLSSFDTSNVTDMREMFYDCRSMVTLNMDNFTFREDLNYTDILKSCDVLDTVSLVGTKIYQSKILYNQYDYVTRIKKVDFTNSTIIGDASYLVPSSATEVILTDMDTSEVTNMSYMLSSDASNLDVSSFDTSNVTNMSYMFNGCDVTNLDLSNFDTSKVTDMSYMFSFCEKITYIDISSFDITNLTNIIGIFHYCRNLIDFDIFDTSKFTNMSFMFMYCESLITIDLSGFDTSNVTNMEAMFLGCTSLKTIDVSQLEIGKVTTTARMFQDCVSLTRLDFSSWDTSSLRTISGNSSASFYSCGMFQGCSRLTYLDISTFSFFNAITTYHYAFIGMPSNATIYVKDSTAQSKILGISTSYRPASWSNTNVIIKSST